uniref:solute:sodium symporter family transporter n=1 Tax=Marinobacterium profundum TaxID=1714300 RepID=UPI000831851E|nr:solute:sodium symporter family transporter [Marinobacterium profundum]
MFAIISFLGFTLLVAVISYYKTRDEDLSHETGYFLAGRSLPWYVIAGSLFLTNISAEQLTGLNGNAFAKGASVMAWETVAAVAMIAFALIFLPRFLKGGITTVPQFLEDRFGKRMRLVASSIFLYAIVIGFLPFVLYAGSITLSKLFDLSTLFGTSDTVTTWIMVVTLGVVGGIYAVFGGLKAVAVSDTVNGVGLLLGGFLVPILALMHLGDGSMAAGFQILISESPERMQAAGIGAEAAIPWHTLFSGILLINLFYWCTNQAIIQRTLGAKNLAEGQKGVLAAAAMKVFGVAMLVLPGIIAWHMHQRGMLNIPVKEVLANGKVILAQDMAYPVLVREVLPSWLSGFFGAVLFGAVLSSFNSGVNSLSTLASLDIYKQYINKTASNAQTVRVGRVFGLATIVVCILIAPFVATADGLYTLMRTIMAVINVPILAVVMMGILSKRTPALAGYIALPFGMIFFYITHFVLKDDLGFIKLNWLHLVGVNFALMFGIMLLVRYLKPLAQPYNQVHTQEVDITHWKYARHACWIIVIMLIGLYAMFSGLGLLSTDGSVLKVFATMVIGVTAIYALLKILAWLRSNSSVTAQKASPVADTRAYK